MVSLELLNELLNDELIVGAMLVLNDEPIMRLASRDRMCS